MQSLRQFSFSRENCLLRNIAYSVLPLYAVFCLLHIAHCCLTNPLLLAELHRFGQSLNPMEMPRDGRVAAELKSLGGRCEQLPWKQRTLAGPAACLWTKGGSGDQRLNLVLCNPTFHLQPSEPQRALLRNYDETMLTMMTNRLMPTAMAESRPLTCRRAASSPQPPSTPPHTCCPKQTVVCVQNSISRCFAKN